MRVLALIADGLVTMNHDILQIGEVVRPSKPVPVTLMFNREVKPIGTAVLGIEGDRVWAEITTDHDLAGLVPCAGGTVDAVVHRTDGVRELHKFRIMEISFCDRNADPRIPAVDATGGSDG